MATATASSEPLKGEISSDGVASMPATEAKYAAVSVELRPSLERGHANHGWLNTYHTFNFAGYWDRRFDSFNALRVMNEDRVTGGNGFGTHPHREFEIFSYVVNGALLHRDSMGNSETIRRGDVQFTSAGTGIAHSEFNASPDELCHFIQIWVKPSKRGLKPSYQTKSWTDAEKRGRLCQIIGPTKTKKTIKINADVKMYATILANGETVDLPTEDGRDYYVHVVDDVTGFRTQEGRTGVTVNDEHQLKSGDGAFIRTGSESVAGHVLRLQGASCKKHMAEVLVFDLLKIP